MTYSTDRRAATMDVRKIGLDELGQLPAWFKKRLKCSEKSARDIAEFCYKYDVPATAMARLLKDSKR